MSEFTATVLEQFDPIVADYALAAVVDDDYSVRYQGARAFIAINYDRYRSFEISVTFGEMSSLCGISSASFNLAEVLRMYGSNDAEFVSRLQVVDQDTLRSLIHRLATLVNESCRRLLEGDPLEYSKLASFRHRESEDLADQRDIRVLRSLAERAWKDKNWSVVIVCYRSIVTQLTSVESKRLDIALKALN